MNELKFFLVPWRAVWLSFSFRHQDKTRNKLRTFVAKTLAGYSASPEKRMSTSWHKNPSLVQVKRYQIQMALCEPSVFNPEWPYLPCSEKLCQCWERIRPTWTLNVTDMRCADTWSLLEKFNIDAPQRLDKSPSRKVFITWTTLSTHGLSTFLVKNATRVLCVAR